VIVTTNASAAHLLPHLPKMVEKGRPGATPASGHGGNITQSRSQPKGSRAPILFSKACLRLSTPLPFSNIMIRVPIEGTVQLHDQQSSGFRLSQSKDHCKYEDIWILDTDILNIRILLLEVVSGIQE